MIIFKAVHLSVTVSTILLLSTYPDQKILQKVAKEVVSTRLAACVNFFPISSIYSWKGNIENSPEFLAIFKTTKKNSAKLKNFIQKTHPYEVPEIGEVPFRILNKNYFSWIMESTF